MVKKRNGQDDKGVLVQRAEPSVPGAALPRQIW